MSRVLARVAMGCIVAIIVGCGDRSVSGGAKGRLESDGNPLADIQVTVHQKRSQALQELGSAVTAADGSFSLVTPGAGEPLWLKPGDYVFTLESVGSPVQIPKDYQDTQATPLTLTWESGELSLNVPGLRYP